MFKKFLRVARTVLILAIVAGAMWGLYAKFKGFNRPLVDSRGRVVLDAEGNPKTLASSLANTRATQVLAAIGLVALNYVFLLGYDFLAIRYIGRPLSLKKLWLASFIGHVSSFNFGAILGGSSMRYRFYSAWGFTPVEVLQLIAVLGVTFWLGVLALAGTVFLFAPFPVSPEIIRGAPDWMRPALQFLVQDIRYFGVFLLLHVVAYIAICAVRRRPLKLFGTEIPLPPPRLTLAQIAVSCADLMIAAGVFYVLLPPGSHVGYVRCLGVFLMGMVAAVITHVPAGVGVFDLTIVSLLPEDAAWHALILYRAIYYLLPLIVAAALFLGFEIFMGREFLKKLGSQPGETGHPPGPPSANGQNREASTKEGEPDADDHGDLRLRR